MLTADNAKSEPEAQPLAAIKVQGAAYDTLPEDLYIPPDALQVFLATFEGPLDLLLYLIRKQNIDIVQIPIAEITRQYLCYISLMDTLQLDLAAEYLLMAAWLAEIKSRLLLPRKAEVEIEEEDPRAELIRRLQEYERIKKAAEAIENLPRLERDIFATSIDVSTISIDRPLPDILLSDVLQAFQAVLKRVQQLSHHQIVKEPLSVRERMSTILAYLNGLENALFTQLFTTKEGRQGVVVSFLAILELSKEGLIEILQQEPYAELRIRTVAAK